MENKALGSVAALVVTYNRKELLTECLRAILCQSVPAEEILVIDNASTDGTQEYLTACGLMREPRLRYIRMDTNTGGAGGFQEGIRRLRDGGCGWIWLMDDDTIPEHDALEQLLVSVDRLSERDEGNSEMAGSFPGGPSFLASAVYGPGGETMNVPVIDEQRGGNGYAQWYRHLDRGMLRIQSATFVSLLINMEAVRRCGLPCREFFIWGDDKEYTRRLTAHYGPAYMVGGSRVIHKRANAKTLHIKYEDDAARIRQYHYLYRNRGIIARYYGDKGFGNYRVILLVDIVTALRILLMPGRSAEGEPIGISHRWLKFRTILKGVWESVTQYRAFRDRIDGERGV